MPVGDENIIKVTCKHKYDNVDDIINTFHFRVSTVPTPNTDANLLEDISNIMAGAFSELQPYLVNNVTAEVIQVYNVTLDGPIGVTSWGTAHTGGSATGEAMPQHDAALALLNTAVKRRIGRLYFGVMSEASQNDGRWSGALTSAIGTMLNDLNSSPTAAHGTVLEYGVYSRKDGAFSGITTIRIQPVVATMRTRKPGRGS